MVSGGTNGWSCAWSGARLRNVFINTASVFEWSNSNAALLVGDEQRNTWYISWVSILGRDYGNSVAGVYSIDDSGVSTRKWKNKMEKGD